MLIPEHGPHRSERADKSQNLIPLAQHQGINS
jgi:hypothetical protein